MLRIERRYDVKPSGAGHRVFITMKPGQKVVCVCDHFPDGDAQLFRPALPVRGTVYVLREVRIISGVPGVLLVGIAGARCTPPGIEYGFKMERFRLLDEVKQAATAEAIAAIA